LTSGLGKFIKDVGWSFVSLGISALVHFILRVILARYFSVDEIGLYSLSFTAYSFGLTLSAFGINAALTKYTAQYREDTSKISALFTAGSVLSFAIGILMGLLLYVISPFVANTLLHMPEMTNLLRIVAISLPFIALQKAELGFLNGQRRMRLFAFINIFQNVFVLALTIVLVVLGFELSGAVWGLVLPVVITSILPAFLLREYFMGFNIRQYAPMIKALLSFGFFVVLANTISTTQGQIDTLLLGFYMTEAEVGYYTTALIIIAGLRLPASAIQLITSPTIATYWGNNDIKAIELLINGVMKMTAIFMLPVVFIVGFFANDLTVLLFGESYAPTALLLQILLAGLLIGSIQTSVGGALASTSYVKVIFRIGMFTLLLSAISNIVIIPIYGMTGAAVAHSFITIISAIVNLVLVHRLVKVKIKWTWFIILVLVAVLIVTMAILFSI